MSDKTPIEEVIQNLHDDLYNSGLSQKEYEPLRNKILEIRASIKQNYVTKEQHKQDVIKAFDKGWDSYYTTEKTAEQYYNENYEKD